MDSYCLPLNYVIRENNEHHLDIHLKPSKQARYQKEVYIYVKEFMKKNNLKKVVDVGCGSGLKLVKYLSEFEIIGYETEPSISFLRKKYPNYKWINSGEKSKSFNYNDTDKTCDLIMACDVIEHILNPELLIDFMKSFDCTYFVFSTPCRNIMNTHFKQNSLNGPPLNKAHIREWTFDEFKMYLKSI